MNIITEEQATARQLALPPQGPLDGLSADFIAELQNGGAFVEYNQQVVLSPGDPIDYISCIVAGRVKVSRIDADYGKAMVAKLGAGEWFGESNLFLRVSAAEEIYADGEAVIWTMPTETMRDLFFRESEGVQLLYNFGLLMAQRLAARTPAPAVS
ncbi:MAG: cyclic nucleotide-binding domain-containing protein [Verrucomicrobiota bacterium]|nr:cyclic nucleotide-binding domain-containing protein [Verrucomicrobiota bacterium]